MKSLGFSLLRLGTVVTVFSATLLGACTSLTTVDTARILPLYDPPRISDAIVAQEALAASAAEKALQAYQIREQEIACYKRFFLNACLADVVSQRRQIDARLRSIDLAAQATIRQERATIKNEQLANSEAESISKTQEKEVVREESLQKAQDKAKDATLKQEKADDKAEKNIALGLAEKASRELKQQSLVQRTAKALASKSREAANIQAQANKVAQRNARIAKAAQTAAEKAKNGKVRVPPAIRQPKPLRQKQAIN